MRRGSNTDNEKKGTEEQITRARENFIRRSCVDGPSYTRLYPVEFVEDLPAILRPHFAGVRVQNAVATAGRLGTTPARFTTMSCGLAVLLIRTHDALAANRKKSKSLCGQASFMLDLENKLFFSQNNTRFTRRNDCVYSEL